MRKAENVASICEAFVYLYDQRQRADYDLLRSFTIDEADKCVDIATNLVALVQAEDQSYELRVFYRELFITHFGKTGT